MFFFLRFALVTFERSIPMTDLIHENVRQAIEEADQKFMALYKQGDCAAVAALYSEDPILMPPGMDFVYGKEAIQKTFEAFRSMGIAELVFEVVEVDHCADHAIEMSRYKLLGAAGQQLDQGKFIVVWKREHGEWKLHRDIFNSSVPPA
jgi:ketosteroid isomerase-like protein